MGETKQRFALLSSPSRPLSKSTEWEKRQKRKPFGNEKGSFKLCHENGRETEKLRPKAATSFGAEDGGGGAALKLRCWEGESLKSEEGAEQTRRLPSSKGRRVRWGQERVRAGTR